MKIRQTVLKRTKVAFGLRVKKKSEDKIDYVIIFRGIEGEPKRRLAPSKERVTAREEVGEERNEWQ